MPSEAVEPRARAGNAKDFLAFLEEFRAGASAHLRRVLPVEVMEAVESSARTEWNPIAADTQYVTAIVQWLGADVARAAWRQFTKERFIHSPAMRALVDGAVRLFGLSVDSLVRVVPFAFGQGFRDLGTVTVELGKGEALVTISDIAREAGPAYGVLFHGVFLGLYDIVGIEPRLEYSADFVRRRIVARFRY